MEPGFLQVGSRLPSSDLYGLGQNAHGPSLRRNLDFKTWPLFTRDSQQKTMNKNGFHPFYLNLERNGIANGVLFRTTQPSEYILLPAPGIVFRTIDSYLEFVVFVGKSSLHVSQMLAEVLGGPPMPPPWALGFHLAPPNDPRPIIDNLKKQAIPVDAVHLSTSLWQKEQVFDTGKITALGLSDYLQETRNINWVMTLSPVAPAILGYEFFENAMQYKLFIEWPSELNSSLQSYPDDHEQWKPKIILQSNVTYNVMYGTRCTADYYYVAYLDFEKPDAVTSWHILLRKVFQQFSYSGIALVQNSPTNTDPNRCACSKSSQCWVLKCPKSEWDSPPYPTAAAWSQGATSNMSDGTICMSGQHYPDRSRGGKHLQLHNSYGMNAALVTHQSCSESGRCLVLSESTSYLLDGKAPHGTVAKLLDTDERVSWESMKQALTDILEFNILGMPLVAADICGQSNQTDDRLCYRWTQLAAFYPISKARFFKQTALIQSAIKDSFIPVRYHLLAYTYSALHLAETQGEPLLRPLFFDFPEDDILRSMDVQFMYGRSLMVAPILDQASDQSKTYKVYIPNDVWYRWKGNQYSSGIRVLMTGEFQEISDLQDIPLFVRGGQIIPTLEPKENVTTTLEGDLSLQVFTKDGKAEGFLYADDGKEKDAYKNGNYFKFFFEQNECQLTVSCNHTMGGLRSPRIQLSEVLIHEWQKAHKLIRYSYYEDIYVNGQKGGHFEYNSNHKLLTVFVTIDLKTSPGLWTISWQNTTACV